MVGSRCSIASTGPIRWRNGRGFSSPWSLAPTSAVGISGLAALQSIVTAQSFGRRSFGTVSGLLNPMNQLASALAVPFTGFLHDATQSYTPGIAVIVVLAMASSLSLLTLRRAGE